MMPSLLGQLAQISAIHLARVGQISPSIYQDINHVNSPTQTGEHQWRVPERGERIGAAPSVKQSSKSLSIAPDRSKMHRR
jgi:hypothetical protein